MKSCPKEENLQAYLDGELTAEASEAVRAHLIACSHCAEAAQEMERAFAVIDSALAAELPDSVPTARLWARIEFARVEKVAPKFTLAWLWNWKLAALAAALLLALAILLFRSANKRDHDEWAGLPAPITTPDPHITPPTPPPDRVVVQQSLKPRKRTPRRRVPTGNAEEAEIATRFYSLVENDAPAPLESGRVVRVEVPAATLVPFGLSITTEALTQPVQADLIIGQDGLARAIRFLPSGQITKTK